MYGLNGVLMETLKSYLMEQRYCLLDFPFGKDIMVFKVKGKMFATLGRSRVNQAINLNLKCDPTEAEVLREKYPAITPGFHLNKIHWNTIVIDQSIDHQKLLQMVDDSYRLVVASLPKKVRALMV